MVIVAYDGSCTEGEGEGDVVHFDEEKSYTQYKTDPGLICVQREAHMPEAHYTKMMSGKILQCPLLGLDWGHYHLRCIGGDSSFIEVMNESIKYDHIIPVFRYTILLNLRCLPCFLNFKQQCDEYGLTTLGTYIGNSRFGSKIEDVELSDYPTIAHQWHQFCLEMQKTYKLEDRLKPWIDSLD